MSQSQLPANFVSFLPLSAGQQMDLGVPTPSLDGSETFTIAGWFQVPDSDDDITVLSQGSLFSFSFYEKCPRVTVPGLEMTLPEPLGAGEFHQLAAEYTPTTGEISFFVDGELVGTNTMTSSAVGDTVPHLVVGNTGAAVGLRRLWLTGTAVPFTEDDDQMVNTRFAATGWATESPQCTWDWGQIPPVYEGVSSPSPVNNPVQMVLTPGLLPGSAGSATFTLDPLPDFSQLSIQGWFYFPESHDASLDNVNQMLIQVGSGPSFNLTATLNSDGTWALVQNLGSNGLGIGELTLAGWHNVAFTWAGGVLTPGASFYLDGQPLVVTGDEINLDGLVPSSVTIGGPGAGVESTAISFCGVIQNVILWNSVVSESDIVAQMMPWFPVDSVDPVAAFNFCQNPAVDVVSGATLVFEGTASLEETLWPASDFTPTAPMLAPLPAPDSLSALRPLNPPTADVSLFTMEREQELVAAIHDYLAQAGNDPQAATLGSALEAKLRQRFASGRAGTPDLRGIVHTEKQGNDWITFYYGENGPEAIYRCPETEFVTNGVSLTCFLWMVDFTCTSLFGLLSIMGIPLAVGAATKVVTKLLSKAVVWDAICVVVEATTITALSVINVLRAIFDGGGKVSFIDAVLDNVPCREYLFMVVEVGVELMGLLIPGVIAVVVMAKLVLVAVQLITVLQNRPAGCPI